MNTPKSMEEAIKNGLLDAFGRSLMSEGDALELALKIMPHVRDYLAQKFGVPTDDAMVLWQRIFPKEKI